MGSRQSRKRKTEPIQLLLVDDQEIVRIGLRMLLESSHTIQVIGEAGTVADAVAEASRLKPDVVLMDVRLPDGSGTDACRQILAISPDTHVLFLTCYADEDAVMAAMCGGASGYLLKEIAGQSLINAIHAMAEGKTILDPAVIGPIISRLQSPATQKTDNKEEALSAQEQRVLALVAEGKTNKEIAIDLGLSDKTVKNYLRHIFQKLQISRRSQAAAYFTKHSPQ